MSDSTVEDWEENLSDFEDDFEDDFPDDSKDKTEPGHEPELEPEPEKICIEDKSTKNMENNEIDEIFSSMADVFRDKQKTFGLPENFSLETVSDFKILGEFISSMVKDNSKDTSKNRNVYTFIRTILDNTIDKLNHIELTECQRSFSVELNNRNRKQKNKSKPKKKKASLRMDRADRDNTIYNDNFEDF